jgi:hypothetical protein
LKANGFIMPLQFVLAVRNMELWSAIGSDFSFVICRGKTAGPGLERRTGYIASWRPLHFNVGAVRIGGSPFETFANAEQACNAMLRLLTDSTDTKSAPEATTASANERHHFT